MHQAELRANWELAHRLRRELYGPIFEQLRDAAYFAQAYLDANSRTVTWPNGADFAPDFLYQYSPEEAPLVEAA